MVDLRVEQIVKITNSTSNKNTHQIIVAFEDALAGKGKLTEEVLAVDGFSGRKIRLFLNNLVSRMANPGYMEIGVYCGASLISAMYQNQVRVIGIDNWSWPESKRNYLFEQLSKLSSSGNSISLLDMDFRVVDFAAFRNFDILFYDGHHDEKDQYDGVKLPQACLSDNYVLVIDDWNWETVRRGTAAALRDAGAHVDMSIEVRTTLDDTLTSRGGPLSDWHNGFYIAAVHKEICSSVQDDRVADNF